MDMQPRPLALNPATLNGLSEKLIVSHHANNYTGAVKRLGAIRLQLAQLDWPSAPVFTVNGLKREELIAANSAWLHELYFDSLGGDGALPDSGLTGPGARLWQHRPLERRVHRTGQSHGWRLWLGTVVLVEP
jgi:Fe-Mn family superoxide dismutase